MGRLKSIKKMVGSKTALRLSKMSDSPDTNTFHYDQKLGIRIHQIKNYVFLYYRTFVTICIPNSRFLLREALLTNFPLWQFKPYIWFTPLLIQAANNKYFSVFVPFIISSTLGSHEVPVHNRLERIDTGIPTGSCQLIPRITNKKDDIEYDG